MKILITGGAGFIGSNLIKKLLLDNHDIISIDNYSTGSILNHQEGCCYINQDINDIDNYNIYTDIDCVYHLAAIARIQPSFEYPCDYFHTNALSTMRLAHYCANNSIPLIYAGTSSVHSGKSKNPYTFSKTIGEEILELIHRCYDLNYSIARFYNVYGPYELTDSPYATLIGRWRYNLNNGLPCILYGDGSKRRDFTHVEDIVDALVLMIAKKEYSGKIFELGRGCNYSIIEVAKMFGIENSVIYAPDKAGEAQITLCDSVLARNILGWEPKLNLEDYITRLKNKE